MTDSETSGLPLDQSDATDATDAAAYAFRAFISYSTDPDYKLSQRIESFLESFHRQPLLASMPLAPIQVCRDGSDFVAQRAKRSAPDDRSITELIERYLGQAEYLVVLCSGNASRSPWVRREIEWFLEHRGPGHVLLVVTEGADPTVNPAELFPEPILRAGLNRLPYYDLRGERGRAAKGWSKVRDAEEELVNLAAHLHGLSSGSVMPVWHREALRKARRDRFRLAGIAILLGAIALVALWQRDVARRALAQSSARELVLHGEASLQKDPQLSLLLAVEAAKRIESAGGPSLDDVASLVRRAVLAAPRTIAARVGAIECFALDSSGTLIAIGTQDHGVAIVDLARDTVVQHIEAGGWVDDVAWNSDGSLLAMAVRNQSVLIWDVRRSRALETLPLASQPQSVHWRPGSRLLAVGLADGRDSRVAVFDVDAKREVFAVRGIRGAWSPNGAMLATGGFDGAVALYTATGALIEAMAGGHARYVHQLAWHPGGQRLATASVDDTVIVWDADAHRKVKALYSPFALSAAWSPDGRLLGSGTGEQFVAIWDAASLTELFKVTKSQTIAGDAVAGSGASGYVLEVAWTKDSRYLLGSDRDGGIRVYSSRALTARNDADWISAARDQVTRSFTREECTRLLASGC